MKFAVVGRIKLGREDRPFRKEVEAETENSAKEKAYALFGSNNGVKRNKIIIDKVEKSS
jgi:ribosomal protein L20A (L18A)